MGISKTSPFYGKNGTISLCLAPKLLTIAHHLLCDGRELLQLEEEFAEHYANGVMPQFAPERLIQGLNELPLNSDLPLISKLIIGDANRRWKKEGQQVMYEEYSVFERDYIQKHKMKREILSFVLK